MSIDELVKDLRIRINSDPEYPRSLDYKKAITRLSQFEMSNFRDGMKYDYNKSEYIDYPGAKHILALIKENNLQEYTLVEALEILYKKLDADKRQELLSELYINKDFARVKYRERYFVNAIREGSTYDNDEEVYFVNCVAINLAWELSI